MPAQKRKKAGERRREIVSAAIELAAEIGPDRVSAARLAERVGLSQPAIFRHFASMDALWLAVGQEIVGQVAPPPEALKGAPPEVQLAGLVRRHLGHVAARPAITAILFSSELHGRNEALRAHFERMIRAREAAFARLIAAAMEAGRLEPGMGAQDAAALILAQIQGLAMRWSLQRRSFDLQAEGAHLTEALLRSWARGTARQELPEGRGHAAKGAGRAALIASAQKVRR